MHNDRNAIHPGQQMDMLRSRNGAQDGRFLIFVGKAFAGKKDRSAVRDLNHHRRVEIARRLHHCIRVIGTGNVDRRNGKSFLFGIRQQLLQLVAGEYSGRKFCTHNFDN